MGGNKKGTISQNTASTYFSIVKAGLKQAFVDEYLTVDIGAKVKGITNIEKPRVALSMNEVQMLVDTPCKDDVLKRAASWISRPLKVWIEASGIKKHITFHCGRHITLSYSLKTRDLQRLSA